MRIRAILRRGRARGRLTDGGQDGYFLGRFRGGFRPALLPAKLIFPQRHDEPPVSESVSTSGEIVERKYTARSGVSNIAAICRDMPTGVKGGIRAETSRIDSKPLARWSGSSATSMTRPIASKPAQSSASLTWPSPMPADGSHESPLRHAWQVPQSRHDQQAAGRQQTTDVAYAVAPFDQVVRCTVGAEEGGDATVTTAGRGAQRIVAARVGGQQACRTPAQRERRVRQVACRRVRPRPPDAILRG